MNRIIQQKEQQQPAIHSNIFCRVACITTETLISTNTSNAPLAPSRIALYFAANIDQIHENYQPQNCIDAVITNDHIPRYLLSYLSCTCSKSELTPYIVYEKMNNTEENKLSWHLFKPAAFEQKTPVIPTPNIAMHMQAALFMTMQLQNLSVDEAIHALKEKMESSRLHTIQYPIELAETVESAF